jgi:hypothetical protein
MALASHTSRAAAAPASRATRSLRNGGAFRPFSGRAPARVLRAAEAEEAGSAPAAEEAPTVVESEFSFNLNE